MPFDMGFNFRSTAGYVTDGAEGVPVLAEAYPHTYTNGNGDSVNAGWDSGATGNGQDRSSANDPRLAGDNYVSPSTEAVFHIDLSSGSNPGAGTYLVDCAIGQPANAGTNTQDFKVKDNTTVLITTSSPMTLASEHYIDATVTDVGPFTSSWGGTAVSKAFATTACYVVLNPAGANGNFGIITHFRLTLQGGAADVRQEHIGFGIGRGILIGR